VTNKDFGEIFAVEPLLPHFAYFIPLEQCRKRLLIFIIFNPFVDEEFENE